MIRKGFQGRIRSNFWNIVIVGGLFSAIGIVLIPIYVHPKLYPEVYS